MPVKLSPHYRDDSVDMLDAETQDYLDREYFQKLPNLDVPHEKLLVVFAGGTGVGKSTLAARLERELQGLRIENDGVKRCLLMRRPELAGTEALHQLTWWYTMDLYRRLGTLTRNGLVIRDGIITWYYDRILPIFFEYGYRLFIIAYQLSDEKSRELIHARGDTPTVTEQHQYELLQDQQIHLQRFLSNYSADITLDDTTVFEHDRVVRALQEVLSNESQPTQIP
ncbi:MAG TPA: AAA family ATPase [Candidatus Saccharimonadaceae bacterium]|nr:AAA family ATPase [Candidatus Saccharimonadaceae bacterium]